MAAVAAQQKELEAKADALRLADVEREARLVELRVEQSRTLGKLAKPPTELRDGLEGEIEVEGLEFSADFLGKVLGSFGVEKGVPAGRDAMGDDGLDVDTQLNFLAKVGAAPAGAEGSVRAMAGDSGNWEAYYNELYEADEQAALELGDCIFWGTDCPSQGGQAQPVRSAAGAAGGAALGLQHAGALQAGDAGAAFGWDGSQQTPSGLLGVSGFQGYGPKMSDSAGQVGDPDWQPQVSASGYGLHDDPGGDVGPQLGRVGQRAPVVRGGCCLATAKVASRGPLNEYLLQADGQATLALAVQEHRCAASVLATQQRAAKGGVVALSVYLHVGEGLSANNLGILWQLAQYLGVLEAEGYRWAAMGDWNMEADVLDFGWARKLRAQIRVAGAPACRQGSGSKIDYFVVSKGLACFAAASPRLGRGASAWPHWPVHLPLQSVRVEAWQQVLDEPRAVPRGPAKPGCARGPWRWTEVARCVQATRDDQGLQIIWDLLLEGVEAEILNRRDLVGPAAPSQGVVRRGGGAAGLRWELFQWRPPQKRKRWGPEAHAWAVLARWATELLSKRDCLAKLQAALGSHRQEEGREAAAARDKFMKSIAATLAHLRMFLAGIEDHVHWRILPPWAQRPFRADANWTEADFERDLKRALAEAKGRQRKLVQADEARWKEWVDDAFLSGAGAAHAASKVPVLQEVLPALQEKRVGQSGILPRALEDLSGDALHVMIAVYHKCEELLAWPSSRLINTMVGLPKPGGGCRLIGLMPALVRVWSRARRPITKAWEFARPSSLVWGTGPGRSSSDSACELNLAKEQARLGGWDSAQVALDLWKAYEMVAPGAQLVQARALGFPLRLAWVLLSTYRQPRALAAFNTTSDLFVAREGNIAGCGHANSLLLVLTLRALQRAHAVAPSVTPRGLVDDAALDWSGPRDVPDDGLSEALRSFSSSMVELRLVMQPQKSGHLASSRRRARLLAPSMRSRGLAEKFWVRNLGRELHGRKVLRTQEKRRLQALAARRSRMAMLRWAAGRRAAALVATGLSPSAGHGAGVAGLADRPLAQLRTSAAVTAGAKAGCGTAAVMLLQLRVDYDPIDAATIPLVMRLASRIWEGRGPLASLIASWCKLAGAGRAGTLSWATAHGPLVATWLTLSRIGWTMAAARALHTDLGETLSMLRVAPRDIKGALVGGVQRWQCRRLVAHLPEGQGETLWLRAVRAIASRARPAAELGAIQAVWAGGHFTNAWRYARGYTDSDMCQEPFRKPIVAMRHQLGEAEQKWTIGDSELPLAHGLPLLPAMPPPAPSGATQEGWPSVVYTDGAGRASRVPEAGSVHVIVSDLQALVTEGNGWSPTAQSARARHASIWRQLHAAAARRDGPPPRFRWVLAHRSLQQALAEGLRPLDWLGNCWADFFANLGAAETRLPNGTVEALHAELQRALDTATFLGWAAARICQLGLWGPLGEGGRREYQATSSYGVQCVHCGRETYTAKARALLDCRPCQPTELGRMRARCRQGRPLASSAAVNASLQVGLVWPQEGNDHCATEAWGRSGPLEAALGTLASSRIVDLMDQSLAYASWMEECVEYVCRMLGEAACRGFFVHNSAEPRSAERPRRAEEFCERGWRGGGPFREAHIDEALQLEDEARQVKLQRLRGYHAAARTFLCDRGSAQHAGGRRGPLYFTFFEPVGGVAEGLQRPVGPRADPAQRRGQPVGHSESDHNSSPDPDAAVCLEVLRGRLRAFASCWVFDLRDSEAAEDTWMAWAAQYAVTWLARPDSEDTRAVVTRRAGSIGLRALAQAMVRQAWLMKADVRRIAVGHLMGLANLEEWLHVAAMQWATLDEVCRAMENIIGEAVVNLPALPGFACALPGLGAFGSSEPPRQAGLPRPQGLRGRGIEALRRPWPGTWHNPQLPLVNATQGGPDDQGSGSGGEDVWCSRCRRCSQRGRLWAFEVMPMLRGTTILCVLTEEARLLLLAVRGASPWRLPTPWRRRLRRPLCLASAAAEAGRGPSVGARDAQRSRSPERAAGAAAIGAPGSQPPHGGCGAFAQLKGVDRAEGLKAECGGRLPPGPQATAGEKKKRIYLSRLLSGKDPYSGRPLG
ncbi:unnamed protein product [Prorocentrum cordatum]|uniref:Calmodulin n=1 Tax=Prorocentrum cordatum TaxID=2364126 RepID=A0ABN9T0N2_9DINO|nr:unnamed protein product [Polarella glacialis]